MKYFSFEISLKSGGCRAREFLRIVNSSDYVRLRNANLLHAMTKLPNLLSHYTQYVTTLQQEYYPGQVIVDKLTKLSKISFSMEAFRADFSQFSSATIKVFILRSRLGARL